MSTRYESNGDADVSRLAKPLVFENSKKTALNRILNSAMAEDLATWDPKNFEARGIPTKESIEVYRRCVLVPPGPTSRCYILQRSSVSRTLNHRQMG